MNRRQWLKTILIGTTSLLLPNFLLAKPSVVKFTQEIDECEYGKYIYHTLETLNDIEPLPQNGPYHRYVSFPTETRLTVHFYVNRDESCLSNKEAYQYIAFNVPDDITQKIARFTKQDIIKILPKNNILDSMFINEYEFKLAHVTYYTGETKGY